MAVGKAKLRKVLVVDDDESIIRVVCRALGEIQIECDSARNGLEALQKLAAENYAVLIVDLMMPQFSGVQLIDKMKELMLQPPIVLVITAHSREYRDVLDTQLVNAIIRKPFDSGEVAEMVRSCLASCDVA